MQLSTKSMILCFSCFILFRLSNHSVKMADVIHAVWLWHHMIPKFQSCSQGSICAWRKAIGRLALPITTRSTFSTKAFAQHKIVKHSIGCLIPLLESPDVTKDRLSNCFQFRLVSSASSRSCRSYPSHSSDAREPILDYGHAHTGRLAAENFEEADIHAIFWSNQPPSRARMFDFEQLGWVSALRLQHRTDARNIPGTTH